MTKQINLKITDQFYKVAKDYAENYGFRNIQELATESIREKVFEANAFDESFSESEINLIDKLIEISVKKGKLRDEKELTKVLG